MFTKLRLERFKSFKDAELFLGPFTVLIGANASGKSNIRDAFRFLNGVGRGYSVAESFGEKYREGELVWSGIRGGSRQAAFDGEASFALRTEIAPSDSTVGAPLRYELEIAISSTEAPHIIAERLLQVPDLVFDVQALVDPATQGRQSHLRWSDEDRTWDSLDDWAPDLPALPLINSVGGPNDYVDRKVNLVSSHLSSIRFVDLQPEAMRRPSLPGQVALGDRGENLSSVLQAICRNLKTRALLAQWLQELLPGDVVDFEFPQDLQGKVLVTLVEANGRRTSAYSASDGTLRFLGMLAALLGPEPPRFFFLEEIENGIHPSRLSLLIQLIEQVTAERGIQVVATTHSPLVLALLSEKSLEHASVTYRLEGQPDTRVRRLLDIPHAREVLAQSSAAHLHESGWFEDALSFTEGEPGQEHAA